MVLLTAACISRSVESSNNGSEPTLAPVKSGDDEQIEVAIKNMYTNDYDRINQSRDVLVAFSEKSPELRGLIISKLLAEESKVTKRPTKSEDYNYWCGLVLVLGDLKATEAIDVLAEEISNSYVVARPGLRLYPAGEALFKIGKPSLPALRQIFLNTSADSSDRFYATLLIGKIGGSEELDFLKAHLKTEKDPHVRMLMKDIVSGELSKKAVP